MKKIIFSLIALMAAVSTNAQVVEVYENGVLHATYYNTPKVNYKVVFKESSDDGTKINDHEYVEIAGIKWATMNVGATTVADSWDTSYGDFYAWGEITTYYNKKPVGKIGNVTMGEYVSDAHIPGIKDGYDFIYYSGTSGKYTFKEWTPAPYDASTKVLTADNDVARAMWGGSWRMPTQADYTSLINACGGGSSPVAVSETITQGGIYWIPAGGKTVDGTQYNVAGALFVVKGDISKRVFFPAAGNIQGKARYSADEHVIYWTSELYTDVNTDASKANTLSVAYDNINERHHELSRYCGLSVRPVSD